MNEQDWTIPTDAGQYFLRQQKTLDMEQRRRGVTKAGDLLGPALGPYAVQIDNLDGDVGAFNGMWIAAPGTLGSPDEDHWVAGYTIANQANGGYQYASLYLPTDAPHIAWERGWSVIPGSGGVRAYSDWTIVGPPDEPIVTTTVSGSSPYNGAGTLLFSRQGSWVEVSGGLQRPSGSSSTMADVGTIPLGFRPNSNKVTPVSTIFAGGSTLYQYAFLTDGTIQARQTSANANALSISGYAYITLDAYP